MSSTHRRTRTAVALGGVVLAGAIGMGVPAQAQMPTPTANTGTAMQVNPMQVAPAQTRSIHRPSGLPETGSTGFGIIPAAAVISVLLGGVAVAARARKH